MKRNITLDILKITMAFMVIGLHAGFLGEVSPLGSYLTVNGIFRIAVPVFFLINGFYFFPVLERGGQRLWFKRVSILYGTWMLFYSYFWLTMPHPSPIGVIKLIKDIVIGYHHLWYISGMLGAALLLLYMKRLSSKYLAITIVITFSLGTFIQYLGNYHCFEGTYADKLFNQNWFHRNAIFFSYPFFCIGYLINKHSLQDRISIEKSSALVAVGILMLLGESYFNFNRPDRDGGFDNFISLILICPFVLICFLKINISENSKKLALYSSAIYFIHSFILSVLVKFTHLEPTYLTLTAIASSTMASYFIVMINQRIRFIL